MKKLTVKCPTCEKQVEWKIESEYRPFCSERCKLIDLGAWADGTNAIPGKPAIEEMFSEDLAREQDLLY